MYKIESQYTGNPIEIKDKKGIEIENILVEGKTLQETTKGYNLLDESLINKGDSTYWVTDKINGINVEANKDYYFTTYTSMSVIRALELGTDKVIKEVTDTIELTFNVENATKVYFTIYKAENIPTDTKILFAEGKEQKQYEPYTGGPTPRPDYPQEINNVKGYRNLFDVNDKLQDFKVDNEYYIVISEDNTQATTTKYVNTWTKPKKEIKANEIYTICVEIKKFEGKINGLYITSNTSNSKSQFSDKDGTFTITNDEIVVNKKYIKTMTSKENMADVNIKSMLRTFISIPAGSKATIEFRISVFKGSTQKHYVPYESNYLELKANGKNLFDKNNPKIIIKNETSYQSIETGARINLLSSNNAQWSLFSLGNYNDYLGKSINISAKIESGSTNRGGINIGYCDKDGNNRNSLSTNTNLDNGDFNINVDINEEKDNKILYLMLYANFDNGKSGDYVDYFDLLIKIGKTKTTYEQYQANSTLVNLQNNELCNNDTLIVQNGYASIDKNKKILELTGEETSWLENTATKGLFQITLENVSVDLTRVHAISTHFIGNKGTDIAKPTDYIDNSVSTYSGNRIFFRVNSYANNLNGFKQFLKDQKAKGTPVIVQYELANNENIELPIVNNLIAYNNYTNIEVIDDLKPNMVIDIKHNLPQSIIDSIKKGKPVKAYLEVQPKNSNEEPIIINEDNYLSTFDLEQFRYIPDEGFIGGCVYNKLVANFINVDNTFNLEDRELKLYIGLYDSEKEDYIYIFYGTYIVQKPENENTTDNSKIECADYMIKFNQPYIDRVTYPTTIKTLLLDICEQLNIKLGTTSFANENFVIENNQFVGGESYREVLKAIAMSAFSWARIKQDVLYLDFEVKSDDDVVETITNDYYYQDKLKLQDTMYGPVNRVVMGMTDIEGENEFVEDKDLQIYPLNKNICPSQFDYWESGNYSAKNGEKENNPNRLRMKQLIPIVPNSLLYFNNFSNKVIKTVVRSYDKEKKFLRTVGIFENINNIAQFNSEEKYVTLTLFHGTNEGSMTYEKYQEMFANNKLKPFMCLNSEENKEFESFETNGVCEIVLNDNPFAYTEEKRRELVQAGTKLFGLKYFPLETETVGFIYLDSGDFASIVDMQGIPRNTLILDYTIKYAGAITDKISSPAKTNSQTKYLYTPQLEQIIRKTEYRVDRAEQTITSTVQTIDGVVTETNQIKQQVDKITQRYEKTGGNNKIRDSVGLYSHSSDEYWINSETGDFEQGYSQDLVGRTESASQISIRNGTKTTTKNNIVNLMTNKEITLTYKLTNDENTTTTIRLYGNNLLYENIVTDKTELKEYSITFIPDRSDLILEITSKTTQQGWTRISDLMLGDSKLWELAQNETWSRVIETNPFGQLIKAENVDTGLFLGIEGLGIYELNNGQTLGEKKGSLTKDGLETNKVICNDIVQNKLIKTNIDINGNDIYIEYIRSDIQ